MIPLEEALEIVDRTLAQVRLPGEGKGEGETLPVRQALGRTVLAEVTSRLDLPPFDKSAMDGYAVLEGDKRDEYVLLGTVAAGDACDFRLVPGSAVKVMTGAPVPEGAGRVIMVEKAQERDGKVRVHRHDGAPNICRKAEDVHRGERILSALSTLGILEMANLVSCGVMEVRVNRAVRVAVISTGDEIVDSPDRIAPGKIMNVNGPLLAGLARKFGFEVTGEQLAPDEPDATLSAIRSALEQADVVIASGGVSVGEYDFVLDALARAGLTVHFSRVATKPGKPTVFASGGSSVFFGLPGNPVSAYVMFHVFVLRAVARMTGADLFTRRVTLTLARDFSRRKAGRFEFVPSRLTAEGTLEPVSYHGSAHLSALMNADGFLLVPDGVKALKAGDRVGFMPTGGRGLSAW